MSLNIKNIARTFNGKEVVKNVSFEAGSGEIIGLLGTSGCGKSTVLRAISGLDAGYEGKVEINGKVSEQIEESTGFIFQEPRLMPWLNVLENVTFGLKSKKEAKAELGRKYLNEVGLAGNETLYPKELSGGMAQRVAIARALITSPEVLLLDEPFSALDAFTKMQLQDLLLNIWREYKTTIVLVTHDIEEATYLCDKIVILKDQPGRVGHEIVVEEPRPRNRGSSELAGYKTEILNYLDLSRV